MYLGSLKDEELFIFKMRQNGYRQNAQHIDTLYLVYDYYFSIFSKSMQVLLQIYSPAKILLSTQYGPVDIPGYYTLADLIMIAVAWEQSREEWQPYLDRFGYTVDVIYAIGDTDLDLEPAMLAYCVKELF